MFGIKSIVILAASAFLTSRASALPPVSRDVAGEFGTCQTQTCTVLPLPGAFMIGGKGGGSGVMRVQCDNASPCQKDYDTCLVPSGAGKALCRGVVEPSAF